MAKKNTTAAAPAFAHPSNLSFSRSINPSLFLMYGKLGDKRVPVQVDTQTVRGTISNHITDPLAAVQSEKKNPANANPQAIERAYLPVGSDTLVVTGQIRFVAGSLEPVMCNSPAFAQAHKDYIAAFAEKDGFRVLAERYLMNLITGRFLWRNRFSDKVTVTLSAKDIEATFDANSVPPTQELEIAGLPKKVQANARAIADLIADTFAGKTDRRTALLLTVEAEVVLGEAAEVYPSQEFADEKPKRGDREVGRVLAKMPLLNGTYQAVLHDQKVGNAIRTIDTWYDVTGEFSPIAIEPHGSSTREAKAWRIGGTSDNFYDLLANLPKMTEEIKAGPIEPRHLFYTAVLVRAGLFGKQNDKKNKGDAE
jgi:CRISPR-associated protein Csy3